MSKTEKYSLDTIRKGSKFEYGSNASVKTSSLPNKGAPVGSKGKPR